MGNTMLLNEFIVWICPCKENYKQEFITSTGITFKNYLFFFQVSKFQISGIFQGHRQEATQKNPRFRMVTGRSRHHCSYIFDWRPAWNWEDISFASFSDTKCFFEKPNEPSCNTSLILRSYVDNEIAKVILLWLYYWSRSCIFSESFLICSISLVYRH